MAQLIEEVTTVSNVGKGKDFTIEIPVGPTYQQIIIYTTDLTDTDVTNLSLKLDNVSIQEYQDIAELKELQARRYLDDLAADDGVKWYMESPDLEEDLRNLTDLGTKGLKTVTIRGHILAGAAGADPDITVYAVKTAKAVEPGMIRKVKRHPLTFATAGEQVISKIPHRGPIASVHFKKSDVTKLRVDALVAGGGITETRVNATKTAIDNMQAEYRQASADYLSWDPVYRGKIEDAVMGTMLEEITFRPTIGTAGQLTVITEFLDSISGV